MHALEIRCLCYSVCWLAMCFHVAGCMLRDDALQVGYTGLQLHDQQRARAARLKAGRHTALLDNRPAALHDARTDGLDANVLFLHPSALHAHHLTRHMWYSTKLSPAHSTKHPTEFRTYNTEPNPTRHTLCV